MSILIRSILSSDVFLHDRDNEICDVRLQGFCLEPGMSDVH